jgi:hypothetical protein
MGYTMLFHSQIRCANLVSMEVEPVAALPMPVAEIPTIVVVAALATAGVLSILLAIVVDAILAIMVEEQVLVHLACVAELYRIVAMVVTVVCVRADTALEDTGELEVEKVGEITAVIPPMIAMRAAGMMVCVHRSYHATVHVEREMVSSATAVRLPMIVLLPAVQVNAVTPSWIVTLP